MWKITKTLIQLHITNHTGPKINAMKTRMLNLITATNKPF